MFVRVSPDRLDVCGHLKPLSAFIIVAWKSLINEFSLRNSDSPGLMCVSDALLQAFNATFCLSEELKKLPKRPQTSVPADSGSIFVGFQAVNRSRWNFQGPGREV